MRKQCCRKPTHETHQLGAQCTQIVLLFLRSHSCYERERSRRKRSEPSNRFENISILYKCRVGVVRVWSTIVSRRPRSIRDRQRERNAKTLPTTLIRFAPSRLLWWRTNSHTCHCCACRYWSSCYWRYRSRSYQLRRRCC